MAERKKSGARKAAPAARKSAPKSRIAVPNKADKRKSTKRVGKPGTPTPKGPTPAPYKREVQPSVRAAVEPSSKGKRAEKAKAAMERGKKRLTKAADLRAKGKTKRADKKTASGMKAMGRSAKLSTPAARKTVTKSRATGRGPKSSDVRPPKGPTPTPYRGDAPVKSGKMPASLLERFKGDLFANKAKPGEGKGKGKKAIGGMNYAGGSSTFNEKTGRHERADGSPMQKKNKRMNKAGSARESYMSKYTKKK